MGDLIVFILFCNMILKSSLLQLIKKGFGEYASGLQLVCENIDVHVSPLFHIRDYQFCLVGPFWVVKMKWHNFSPAINFYLRSRAT